MKRVWIDTDIALGAPADGPNRDVDDGWALAAMLRTAKQGDVDILGISACDGNIDAITAFKCAEALLQALEQSGTSIVSRVSAAQSMAKLERGTILLALGPLTNIAGALALDCDLANRVALVSVGGVLNRWNVRRRLSDLNIRRDPIAAALVHKAFANCRQMPLDVVDKLTLTFERMEQIRMSGHVGCYLAEHSQRWLNSAKWRHGKREFPVWDLAAALAAIDALPDAQYDARNRLIGFDVDGAWSVVESLLAR